MSATLNSTNQIKSFWDSFFHAETGTYEKSLWLDLLLAEFLIQLKDGGDAVSIISFCPIGGVVTLVGCELLCGIHCVTSSSCSQYLQLAKNNFQSDGCVLDTNHPNKPEDEQERFLKDLVASKPQKQADEKDEFAQHNTFHNPPTSIQPLQKYVLKGPAWRSLVLLQVLGVEGLSCSRQLSSVLVWLYGELSGSGGVCNGPNPYLPLQCRGKTELKELFTTKLWLKSKENLHNTSKKKYINLATNNLQGRSRRKPSTRNVIKKSRSHKRPIGKAWSKQQNAESSDSNKDENDDLKQLTQSFTLKARFNSQDFEYFTTVVRSDEELYSNKNYNDYLSPAPKEKKSVDDYMTDRHREVLKSEISQYEFSVIVISLLHQLCEAESNISGSEALHINMQCVNFAIKHLCTLQFESSAASRIHMTFTEVSRLKASLTDLLIVSLDKVLLHPELSVKVIQNGFLPMLLRLLEDATYKLDVLLQKNISGNDSNAEGTCDNNSSKFTMLDTSEATDLMRFLFGVSYSIMAFLYFFLMHRRSLENLHDFMEQFKLFSDCRKGLLLRESVSLLLRIPSVDKKLSVSLVKTLIDLISKLISGMKRVRSEAQHSSSCSQTRHVQCRLKLSETLQHHSDIMGTCYVPSRNMGLSPLCCVSVLYGTLTSLLGDENITSYAILRSKLLRCMKSSGSCCCFPPQLLLEKAIRMIHTYHSVANLCFSVLEQTLYGELGTVNYHRTENMQCSVCEKYFTDDELAKEVLSSPPGNKSNTQRTIVDDRGARNLTDSSDSKIFWQFLMRYNSLLKLEDHAILHSTISHLLRISSQCRSSIKHDLLFVVIYPSFLSAKNRYLLTNSESAFFVTLSCLSSFSTLLSSTSFAEEFIQKGGLAGILELMALPEFSKQCCSVLEIAVVIEILKIHIDYPRRDNIFNPHELQLLPSLTMLFKSLGDITEKAFKYFRSKMDSSQYKMLIDLSKEKDAPYCSVDDNLTNARGPDSPEDLQTVHPLLHKSKPINIKNSRSQQDLVYEMQFSLLEQNVCDNLEHLKNVWTFWKTSAALCLYCPLLRKFIVRQSVFRDSYKLLNLLLYYLCNGPSNMAEMEILIKMLEAVITINLSVADITMDRSKVTTISILRNALLSEIKPSIDNSNIKSLCKMLIRVATIHASEEQVMPPVHKVKLPPLPFPSHSDEECASSGDDDDSNKNRPYMSEESEPYHTADEGYEADNEVGVVDMLSNTHSVGSERVFVSANTSHHLEHSIQSLENVSKSGTVCPPSGNVLDCREYKKNNLVVHPELCVMVVDLLLDLINRILDAEDNSKETGDSCPTLTLCNIICSCTNRLATIFFQESNCSAGAGLITRILSNSASRLLKSNFTHFRELQRSVLNLIYVLATRSIDPSELKLYMELFTSSDPPLDALLDPLCKLVDNVHPNVPDFVVCFPVEKYPLADNVPTFNKSSDELLCHIEPLVKSLQYYHTKADIQSCWSKMGVWCGIEGVGWGIWLNGFSVALWLRVQEFQSPVCKTLDMTQLSSSDGSSSEGSERKITPATVSKTVENTENQNPTKREADNNQDGASNYLHMLSVGHDSLILEFWINTRNGDVTIKLTRPDNESNKIVGETTVEGCLPLHQWNHFAMNCKEIMQKRKIYIEVTLFVNGSNTGTALVPVNGILLRKARPACLMIGHSSSSDSDNSSPNGSWYLSGLTLFRVPVFNEYNVMYLMSHGPNITPLTSCQSGNHLPDFTIFNDDILYSDIDWDQVFEMSSVNIREMQDNLLLNYSASNPLSVELYHQTIPNPLFGGRIGGGVKGGGFGLPVSLVATWTGLFLSSQHKGLPPAVFILGGPQIFLYLFARVVELNGTSEDQARSLGILLKVICSDTRLYSMFYQDELLSMLQTVFSTSKCQMSNHYLKVLIDASCSNSINQSNVNIGDLLHLQTQSDAVILHPYILVTLIRSWRELERATKKNKENAVPKNKKKADQSQTGQVFSERNDAPSDDDGGLLGTVFLAMGLMLREDNMFRKFNVYQMNRVNMVEHLLLLCKERFLNSDFARLGDTVSVRLVEVIKLLMGFPPLLHHMALLSDFLILMHQASTTFITHARSSFYFLLSPALLPSSHSSSNILGLPIPASQKKTKKNSRRKRNSSSASISDNLDMHTIRNISTKKNDSVMDESELNESIKSARIEDSYDIISNESLNNIENTPSNSNAIIKESISVNVSKQSKAIINMITKQKSTRKERRKRNHLRNSGNSSSGLSTLDGGANDEPGTSGRGLLEDETRNADSPLSNKILTNEYIVIDNEEIDRQEVQNDSIALYQELRSPVLLQNLRGGSTNSSTVCEGLLLLLEDTIAIMPDTYLDQVLGVVIHSEMFLILGNHREASVRTAVLKVVCALSQRCPPDYMKNLEQGYFFYHLANQISLFPASYDLVSACATLITEHRSRLEFQLEDNAWANVTDKEILKSPPLLAILPCTLHDISLTHNAILLLKKIVERGSVKVLNEVGICEVILKCLQAIGSISDASFDGRDLILEDLRCLLNMIAIKTIYSQNSLPVRMDLHFQLRYLELMERSRFHISSPDCHVAKVVRDTQCSLFESELDFIEEKLKVVTVKSIGKTAKYFTTVLSGTSGGSDREHSDHWSEVFGPTVKLPIAQHSSHKLSRSDLTSRHGALLTQVTAFLMSRDFELQPSSTEINLIERIFSILIIILSDNHRLRSKWWNSLSGTDRRGALCEMFHWMISPGCSTNVLKRIAIKYIFDSTVSVQKIILPSDPSNQRKLAVYLTSAMDVFTSEGSEDKTLKAFVLRWISELQPDLVLSRDTVVEEACHLVAKDVEQRQCVQTQSYSSIQKSVFSKETLSNKLTESAMSITRRVVDTQNSERKSFLEHLRKQQSVCIASAQKWHRLIELIAHEQGIWHIKDSYPNSWEIDPTEGPSRVRVRLRRCHLDIKKEFVKEDFQQKTDSASLASPLAYLFDWPQNSLQSRLLERLHLNESVSYMTRAVYVTVMSEQHGELLLSDRCIHFLPEPANASSNNSVTGVYWPLDSIISVSTRRWELRERAVEVFLSSGHAHLLAFDTTTDMEAFLRALDNCHLPNRFDIDSLPESVNLWRNGSMTNWEYLMHLNGWAGRTYNDLMQYPVYPFILADYTSVKLDLNKSTSFRDLRKPMAVQNQKNETHYIKNYNDLKQARKDGSSMIPGINGEPFHYGSHYSNSGTVLHFLVRLPPFTKLFLSYQDNNFDMPDRTFHSLQTTWRLTSCESTTDVKELIPEFFYLPHFLRNSESLNLGVRQCGISVDDVELATWSVNARLFTLIHRQALESSYVRENLPHWIDLVFGYKQTGQAAVDAVNVFHAATYYGFDSSVIKDDLERNAWETMVRLYGQTPRQLLKHPHPHAITDLQHIPEIPLQVLDNVTGLRWGRYCGSPEEMEPKVIWQRQQVPSAFKLIPFLTNEVIGVPSHTTVMLTYVKNKGFSVLGNTMIGTVGLITWGHSDGIIRIKQKKDFPPEPLIQIHNIDRLCVVSHGTGDTMGGLWLGLESGRILVLPPAPVNSSPPTLNFSRRPVCLIGHSRAIVAICVSAAFGVAATASEDGTVIIWDIDRFTYVRTIPNDCNTISHVCISNTLCDVATVHQITVNTSNTSSKNTDVGKSTPKEIPADIEKGTLENMKQKPNTSKATSKSQRSRLSVLKSKIRIHTINSVFVGEVKIAEKVTCICYSNAAEGVSVNAVAVGVHTGSIRLFSSWDLKPIIVLTPPYYTHPLVSICYSHDAHHLYAAGSDGTVMIWEGENVPGKTPNFRVLSSLSIF